MPTHLDVLVGDYRRAISSNIHATLADEKYVAVEGPNKFYSLYRLHNYHSLIYAAMHADKKQIALETADRMERTIPAKVLRSTSPNLADWLEGFVAVHLHVMVRFGMWCEIIAMALPKDQELYCVTTAIIHYAKGVAYAITNRVTEHPNNVWALQGYYECLVRLGRDDEAKLLEPQVKVALAVADVLVKSSCFCRLNTSDCPDVRVLTSYCK